jgi:quercetin dioxygenase-like cupin family protein
MDLTHAPNSTADEKSTPLNYFQISEIQIPAAGALILARKMRLRRLDVFPGGVIGVHDHSNRPAILFVLRGSMTIYDNKSDSPTVVTEGESVREFGVMHYALNNSDENPLSLLTFDLLDDGTQYDHECTGCWHFQMAGRDPVLRGRDGRSPRARDPA